MTTKALDCIRIDLHAHSTCSDGMLPPELVARRMVDAGVVLAALTDHDTLDGQPAFARVLQRHGIGCVTGVELTTFWRGEELHILGYGFDATNPELLATLGALRKRRDEPTQSVTSSLRRLGTAAAEGTAVAESPPYRTPAEHALEAFGTLGTEDAIALLHRAGGQAFLAHPGHVRDEIEELRAVLIALQEANLDGAECVYGPDPPGRRTALCALARELGLLVSAGSDLHASETPAGVEIPTPLWHALRSTLGRTSSAPTPLLAAGLKRRQFARHIIAPSVLAVGLFGVALWALILPDVERALMNQKRELIRELTHAAWSILDDAEKQVQDGRITRDAAQQETMQRIAAMRYGHENKDYFWIQDMRPRMIMHPDRRELEGQDLSTFRDAAGAHIFVEFADVVRRHGEDYVDYVWQWPGDPRHIGSKESYVRGFAPWGWVIGTGIYLEDVQTEIARIESGIVKVAAAISFLLVILLINVVRYSHHIERDRADAVEELRETTERYRQLVEATTEGSLLVVEGHCRYVNPRMQVLLGYTAAECALLELADILPATELNASVWNRVRQLGQAPPAPLDCLGELRRRDGRTMLCALFFTPVALGGRNGIVMTAKEASHTSAPAADAVQSAPTSHALELVNHAPCGLFSARLDRRGSIITANQFALRWLRPATEGGELALTTLFANPDTWDVFLEQLKHNSSAKALVLLPPELGPAATLAVHATVVRSVEGAPEAIVGTLSDVSAEVADDHDREALVERLQTPLLFLHQRVGLLAIPCLFVDADHTIRDAATAMADANRTAALIRSTNDAVGIVTIRDLCHRVLSPGRDVGLPVRKVMSLPVATIPANAPVYEALLCMHERNVHHLAVTDSHGTIEGIVSDRELLPFQNYGVSVLTREIARAALVEDVVRSCRRTGTLARSLLDSGANPRNVTRLITSICDAATERFVALAIETLGPAPGRFAFLALGSQSRHEQTLSTDQDNAIVFIPVADEDAEAAYYLELGRRVCGWLEQAGYAPCHGHVMASNRIWCRTLKAWKIHYRYWVQSAEPEELQIFSMCFDFRAVAGDPSIETELRAELQLVLGGTMAFFAHFARHALQFKPPVMFLGRLLASGITHENRKVLNLKDAMMPIVTFARLYALRYDIARTHTLERIDALVTRGLLPSSTRDEITVAYEFLMRLRLRQQATCQGTPGNQILLRRLGHSEKVMLRQAFAQIRAIQARIGQDFLGGAQSISTHGG